MNQLEMFAEPKAARPQPTPDQRDKRKLVWTINRAAKGGLVNGMTKAQLRRHAPAKLPRVTI